jgi:hypothetical protein
MITFEDDRGGRWIASVREEDTPRHHGRWYLVIQPESDESVLYPLTDIRWQTERTADRTLKTMSVFELRRRLDLALRRAGSVHPAGELA